MTSAAALSSPRLFRALALVGLTALCALEALAEARLLPDVPGPSFLPLSLLRVALGSFALLAFWLVPPAERPPRPGLLGLLALALLLAFPWVAAWREAVLQAPVVLAAAVSRVSEPASAPEPPVLVDLRRLEARAPLRRLVGRNHDVRLDMNGFLRVDTSGRHRFRLTADDTATLRVANTLVFEGTPGGVAEVVLTRGVHPVFLRFEQTSGAASLRLEWDPPGWLPLLDLSAHLADRAERLSPRVWRPKVARARAALTASLLWWAAAAGLVVAAAGAKTELGGLVRRAGTRLRGERPDLAAAAGLFLLSGVAALVYQVAWQRLLALASGVGVLSVSVIVAAFMAGLGLGSELGGRLSQRLSPSQALRAFAVLELLIAGFAVVSPWLYYDVLYLGAPGLYRSTLTIAAVHFLALLPPTLLMGMSLPCLARAFVEDREGASRTISVLYGVNVVGAALGAALTPWVLLRFLGVPGAILAGAACNALAGVGALGLCRGRRLAGRAEAPHPRADAPSPPAGPEEAREPPGRQPFGLWLVLYALSGFCALALEIVWFRVFDVAVRSTAFSFGTVLSLYLTGLAVGSLAGTRLVHRVRRPLLTFLTLQAALIAYAGATATLLTTLPPGTPVYAWYLPYWAKYGGLLLGSAWSLGPLLRLYVLLPGVLFLPATVLMGLSFPVLQSAVQDDPARAGRRVGALQAANIAGCVVGSLLVGLASLTILGTTGTLRLLMACGLGFVALGVRQYGGRPGLLASGLVLVANLFLLPGQGPFWARLHGQVAKRVLVHEDASALGLLTELGGSRWRVSVNGQGHSYLPYGGIHSLLGALPAVLHPEPRELLVIGLGSGDTAWAAGCRKETRTVHVFEIAAPQPVLLRRLLARESQPQLERLLGDPRLRLEVEDGRHALHRSPQRWDVVQMDVLEPQKAMSGNTNSLEFFRLVGSRLGPRGLFCAWVPTLRIRAGFRAAFPHVLMVPGHAIFVGSNDPLPLEPVAWRARLLTARGYLGEGITSQVERVLESLTPPPPQPGELPVNRDLFPRDEFLTPAAR